MKKTMLPKFKTIKEEAEFWDTHDITDYISEMKPVKVFFQPENKKQETIVLRIQSNTKQRLQAIAEAKHLPLSTLLRLWLIEKIKENHSYV